MGKFKTTNSVSRTRLEISLPKDNAKEVDIYQLKNGKNATLIAVHGAGGLLCFGRLSRFLGQDHAFHVLQGKGLDRETTTPPFSGIHVLAESYVDAISDLRIKHPFFICGRFSPIVLETGRRLVERGFSVKAMIVFDSGIGAGPDARTKSGNSEPHKLVHGIKSLIKSVPGVRKTAGAFREWYSPHIPRKHNPFRLINEQLKIHYEPKKKFPGRVILIRSDDYASRPDKRKHIPSWRAMSNELRVYVVPGNHQSMWQPPDISHLGVRIKAILDGSADDIPLEVSEG